ncbi:MAG: integrase [Myxococcota bacterium]
MSASVCSLCIDPSATTSIRDDPGGTDAEDAVGARRRAAAADRGTRMAIQGVAPAALQKLMRHSTPALTMKHYVHLDVDDLRAAQELGLRRVQ